MSFINRYQYNTIYHYKDNLNSLLLASECDLSKDFTEFVKYIECDNHVNIEVCKRIFRRIFSNTYMNILYSAGECPDVRVILIKRGDTFCFKMFQLMINKYSLKHNNSEIAQEIKENQNLLTNTYGKYFIYKKDDKIYKFFNDMKDNILFTEYNNMLYKTLFYTPNEYYGFLFVNFINII